MDSSPWSATRARTFRECRRKYYYRYVLSPLARRPGGPEEAYQADRIKDLVGLEAWSGEVVHQTLRHALDCWRVRREFPEEAAVAHAARLLSRQFRASHDFWSEPPEAYPRRPPLLDLHYYTEAGLSRERAAALKEVVTTSVRSFYRSLLSARIRGAGPANWLPIDRNAAARLEDGTLILVRPDFAFRHREVLHILDWKTGRPDPFWETVQVTCYALYAAEKWHCPLERIRPQLVYLYPEFHAAETEYTPDSLRSVTRTIRDSQEQMRALAVGETPPPAERFPVAEDSGACRRCQFRGMCGGARR